MIRAVKYPRWYAEEEIYSELITQLISSTTRTMAITGSTVSGVIHSPASITTSGEYVFGLLQSADTIN